MTDFEAKPAGFTAVNGRAPSPLRSIHSDYRPSSTIDDSSKNAPTANGNGHSRSESGPLARPDLRIASRPEDRPAAAAATANAPSFHPSASPSKSELQVNMTDSDRSPPAKKRTFPEAFDDRTVHGYAPRPAPREGLGIHSPDRYQETGDQGQQPGSAQAEREGQDFESHTSGPAGSPYSNEGSNDETERRLAAALKEDGMAHDSVRGMYVDNQDDDQETPTSAYPMHGDYGTPTRTAAGVAMNADRKRKRVFSNRTKTGCLTCRKRKKKCDELHPECNNCIRGGFVCEGYSSRTNWQRPTPQQKQAPVPLQSKVTGGTYGGTPTRTQPAPYAEATPEFVRGPELRPDERPRDVVAPALVTTPKEPMPPAYQRLDGRFVNQAPPRYEPEVRPAEPQPQPHPQPEPAPHDSSLYPPAPTYPPPPPQQLQAPLHSAAVPAPAPIPPPTAPMHQPTPAVAKAVLQRIPALPPASSLTKTSPPIPPMSVRRIGEPSERDKMLQGDYYLPYTSALMRDRDQCAAALYRFNQACQNPALGFSHLDRERLFSEIVKLRPTPDSPALGSPIANGIIEDNGARPDRIIPQGSIGAGCVIEAPFHCDYGYNLNIGADVVIGGHCRITDTCNVSIGNGVVFSPGVTLMCATYAIHPDERRRGKGKALGRAIVIEDEAWIGTNVTILPGVRVGRHSTVGAGSLIHKDVPPYTLIAGNPQKVVRGIGGMEESRSG